MSDNGERFPATSLHSIRKWNKRSEGGAGAANEPLITPEVYRNGLHGFASKFGAQSLAVVVILGGIMRSATVRTSVTDADLLVAFLNGDRDAREELPLRLQNKLLAIAYRLAPDLAQRDLHKDIVQQMWLLLLQKKPGTYDPRRSAPLTYLGKLLWRARRDVYAENTPPGARTRPKKKMMPAAAISSTPTKVCENRREPTYSDERRDSISLDFAADIGHDLYKRLASAIDTEKTVSDEIDTLRHLEWVRENAPDSIYTALRVISWSALTLRDAAKLVDMDRPRQTINRWVAREHVTLATFGLR